MNEHKSKTPIVIIIIITVFLLLAIIACCICGIGSCAIIGATQNVTAANPPVIVTIPATTSSLDPTTITPPFATGGDVSANSKAFNDLVYNWVGDRIFSDLSNEHFALIDATSYQEYWGEREVPTGLTPIDLADFDDDPSELNALITRLSAIDYDSLDDNQKVIYNTFNYYLSLDVNYMYVSSLYYEPLGCINGIHVSLPILIAEYDIRSKEDIDTYMSLLASVPAYFDSVAAYEQKKSDAGLFMSDIAADDVIEACESVISVPVTENYMYTTFADRIDPYVTEEEKQAYIEQNEQYLSDYIYPSYEQLAGDIQDLKGSGVNQELGLAGLPDGASYYAYLVASSVGTTESVDDIFNDINQSISDYSVKAAQKYSDAVAREYQNNHLFQESDPEEMLSDLINKMSPDFPSISDVNYTINPVSKEMEAISSPAYYLIPPIDAAIDTENRIYINYGNNNGSDSLYYTMAHEGYPGHLYQTNYFRQHCSDPFRNEVTSSGYVEGYATYAEMYAYLYTDSFSEDLGYVLMYNHATTLAYYSLFDIGINYYGWDKDQVRTLVAEVFKVSEDKLDNTTDNLFNLIVQQPGNYLKYYVGYLKIMQLQELYFSIYPDGTLLDFNTRLLDYGAIPFDVLENCMFYK